MEVIPGAEVAVMKYAPMELQVQGYELTLRMADTAQIEVKPVEESNAKEDSDNKRGTHRKQIAGLGEGGRYHAKADENPLPEGIMPMVLVLNMMDEMSGNGGGININETVGQFTDACMGSWKHWSND